MRAYGFTALGGPEVESFLDVPEPTPGEGELLVRVRAAGVNPGDWRLREGSYGPVAPAVLGREVAGTVAALGPGVSGFAVGDAAGPPTSDRRAAYAFMMPPPGKRTSAVTPPPSDRPAATRPR